MKKNVFLLCVLAVMALTVTNCETEKPPAAPEGEKLEGTSWTLVGFFDVGKNELKEADRNFVDEPYREILVRSCEGHCYTLGFLEYGDVGGATVVNSFMGGYVVDYTHSTIEFREMDISMAEDPEDGERYYRDLRCVQAFELNDAELKLYYNNRKNYLLFRPWGRPQ